MAYNAAMMPSTPSIGTRLSTPAIHAGVIAQTTGFNVCAISPRDRNVGASFLLTSAVTHAPTIAIAHPRHALTKLRDAVINGVEQGHRHAD